MDLLGDKVFDFPKPSSLIERLMRYGMLRGEGIFMDFFSGSASSAHAVLKMNSIDGGHRSFIAVQLDEDLEKSKIGASIDAKKTADRAIHFLGSIGKPPLLTEIGEERIRRAGDKIKAELEESNSQLKLGEEPKQLPDIGFRVFKLDESGIRKPEPGQLLVDCVKPDRTDMDIVFEMMLKWGLELTLPVEQEDMAGYPCYTVAYGELVCCLAPGLTIDALEVIAEIEPRRVLILDSILDDSLKLNAVQIFKRVEERTGREVELRTV